MMERNKLSILKRIFDHLHNMLPRDLNPRFLVDDIIDIKDSLVLQSK